MEIIIAGIIAFTVAITIHEASHALISDKLGDPTARLMGRLSLNPIKHMDIYGTFLIPLLLILIRSPFLFGWAKPVMFDPFNLKNPRRDSALIALSGPVSNIILAILLSIMLRIIGGPIYSSSFLTFIFIYTISTNITLAIFNLIPIHPLDGGKIFVGLLPEKDTREADVFLHRYGTLILFMLIFPFFGGQSPLFSVIGPVINFILKLLLPGMGNV